MLILAKGKNNNITANNDKIKNGQFKDKKQYSISNKSR